MLQSRETPERSGCNNRQSGKAKKFKVFRHVPSISWRNKLKDSELANLLVDSLLDKKGNDLLLLDMRDQAIFTDYFLLCSGESNRQLKALAEGVKETAKKEMDVLPWSVEGDPESGWVLVDYGGVIIHLFSPEQRRYYNLEELWDSGHVVLRIQ